MAAGVTKPRVLLAAKPDLLFASSQALFVIVGALMREEKWRNEARSATLVFGGQGPDTAL